MQSTHIDIDGPTLLEETSNSFLRAIKNELGDSVQTEVLEALKPILGKEWMSRQIYWTLAGGFKDLKRIRVQHHSGDVKNFSSYRISAIKSLRFLTDCGLIEAKNAMEKSLSEPVVCNLRKNMPLDSNQPPAISWRTTAENLESFLIQEIENLRQIGWIVEII